MPPSHTSSQMQGSCLSTIEMESNPFEEPLAVISPHLDDAVLSCGDLLSRHPESVVVTVFAGFPAQCETLQTDWDRKSGFGSAAEAVHGRREEDRQALLRLEANPCWMEFADSQYKETPSLSALVEGLLKRIRDLAPMTVVIPAGLYHSDHELTHSAALQLARHMNGLAVLMYADALYRSLPCLLSDRLVLLREAGFTATPLAPTSATVTVKKAAAVRCYASQIRALQTAWPDWEADVMQPERYWKLTKNTAAT